MDSQTTMNTSPESPSHRFSRKASRVARDVLTIIELQGRLFLSDLVDMRRGAMVGTLACLMGMGLLVAAIPLGLAGAGIWIAAIWDLGPGPGLVGATVAACLLAAVMLAAGYWHLRQRVTLARSRDELAENIALLKKMLNELSHPSGASSEDEIR
jgi:uncharacterized membrane protein YqjE